MREKVQSLGQDDIGHGQPKVVFMSSHVPPIYIPGTLSEYKAYSHLYLY